MGRLLSHSHWYNGNFINSEGLLPFEADGQTRRSNYFLGVKPHKFGRLSVGLRVCSHWTRQGHFTIRIRERKYFLCSGNFFEFVPKVFFTFNFRVGDFLVTYFLC